MVKISYYFVAIGKKIQVMNPGIIFQDHTGHLLHTLLLTDCKSSVLPMSWSRNSGPLVFYPCRLAEEWWAGTTDIPQMPPSQGCEQLHVMPLLSLKNLSIWSYKTLRKEAVICHQITSFIRTNSISAWE